MLYRTLMKSIRLRRENFFWRETFGEEIFDFFTKSLPPYYSLAVFDGIFYNFQKVYVRKE
jgi:hypothetical protein